MERDEALKRLILSLSEEQTKDLQTVIETAEVQGDYNWNGEDSVYEDDVNSTLRQLASEFNKFRYTITIERNNDGT